jgi:MAP3K TRAFs-binding domain
MKPFCFVLMPFGKKADSAGRVVDFNSIYQQMIAPAISAVDLEPLRADEEAMGGVIHKPMFERLALCDYAVADLTGANSNVAYELGIRHALRPRSTAILFAEGTQLPFDLAMLRGQGYRIDDHGQPEKPDRQAQVLSDHLRAMFRSEHFDDSPFFQLMPDMPRPTYDRFQADAFRTHVLHSNELRAAIADARRRGAEAVRAVAERPEFKTLSDLDPAIVGELFWSFGQVQAHRDMIELYERLPLPLQRAKVVRERLSEALVRVERSDDAERVLKGVIEEYGPSSETYGRLGRVYKDMWEVAKSKGSDLEAKGLLKRAIATYVAGFQEDWRDTFPGINAVTLMELESPPSKLQAELLPVVSFSAKQRLRKSQNEDYWGHATVLELAVLSRHVEEAEEAAANALAVMRAAWEVQTTVRNLQLVRKARHGRGEDCAWIERIEDELMKSSQSKRPQ